MKEYLFKNFHFKSEPCALMAGHAAEQAVLFQIWSPFTPHTDFCQYTAWTPFITPGSPCSKFNAENFVAIPLDHMKSIQEWDKLFNHTLLDHINSYLLTDLDWCQLVIQSQHCQQILYVRSSTHTQEIVSQLKLLLM